MTQNIPTKRWRPIGDGTTVTRRAGSYTPANDFTLRHFSFVGVRLIRTTKEYTADDLNEVNTVEWEIRTGVAGPKPDTSSSSLLASGSFDWRYTSAWKLFRPIKFTINLASPLQLTGGARYWFILKMPDDEQNASYPLGWVDTYDTGAPSEVDINTYGSEYIAGSGWQDGDNDYNLTLYILDEQAGSRWHVVIDGDGYMQPDRMKGYRCEQQASGLAQSRGGQSEFSQLRYPYSNLSQDNWTSGSGQLEMDDPAAFLYSMSLDTTIPHQTIIGPAVYLTGVETSNPAYEPTSIVARHLPDPENSTVNNAVVYYAQRLQAPAGGMTATTVGVRANRTPWQRLHNLSVAIFSDSGGSPDANLTGWQTITPVYKWNWYDATISQALTGSTYYWVVVKTDQAWGGLPEHRVMFDNSGSALAGAAKYSANGTSWSTLTGYSMAFRINYGAAGAMNGDVVKMVYGQVNGSDGLYAAAGQEVYKWSEVDGHWDALSASLAATATDIICFNDTLFVAQGYSNNARAYDGTTWSDMADAYKYWHIGKGYLWASTSANTVRHSNDGSSWSADVTVGESLWDITAFANYQGRFIVGKENGLWEIDDQDLAIEYLRFDEHAAPDNCKGMTVWSGMLFIPVQSTIWRWQGSQYRDIGPTDKKAGPTAEWPNRVTRMASTPPYLLGVATPVVSPGFGGLMAYNGMGWHHLAIATRADQLAQAITVTTEIGTEELRIWYAEGDRITYVKFPTYTNNRYDWPSAKFEITSGTLVCSWWDGGLKDALKFWNRLTLIADIPDNTYIEVYCARDGQDWNETSEFIYLGELRADTLTDTGEYTLMFPDGMVAKSIQPIFILGTEDNSKTPRIKAYNIESLVRQVPVYTYSFRVLLADNITRMDRTTESSRDANQMWEELQRAAASNAPIIISFPSKSFRGVISYLREETYQFRPSGMDDEIWERVAVVSVIEAT